MEPRRLERKSFKRSANSFCRSVQISCSKVKVIFSDQSRRTRPMLVLVPADLPALKPVRVRVRGQDPQTVPPRRRAGGGPRPLRPLGLRQLHHVSARDRRAVGERERRRHPRHLERQRRTEDPPLLPLHPRYGDRVAHNGDVQAHGKSRLF